jgi:adenylate cyclase
VTQDRNRLSTFLSLVLNGGPSNDDIPQRVQAEIAKREDAAERLIGWVQLCILLAFATLYAVSPRAEGSAGENYTPTILAAYLVFTLLRLGLAYRSRPPGWFLVLSILIDVALLCALIFSFHIQYDQPAAFYLKAPTMIYMFIFISVRALRFDPRYVLASGLIAIVGWIFMVAYALNSDMGKMYVTRNYVDYLTSNSILIGAELDKIFALLGVTIVLTLALYRARYVAIIAAKSSTAAQDLGRFFAPEVASSITSSDELPEAGHCVTRDVGVLFVDVRAFTATADTLPSNTVMDVLGHYQQAAITEIQRFNGRVDKFLGDGILATFGGVEPSETYAADALHAATAVIDVLDAMQEEFAAMGWPGPFLTGAAAAAGPVKVGVVGANGRLEFTVIGSSVNLAAKLEDANKTQQTRALTDAATLRIARSQGYARDVQLRTAARIDGIGQPIDIAVLA